MNNKIKTFFSKVVKQAILYLYLLPILSLGQKVHIEKNEAQFEPQKSHEFYECKESEYFFDEGLAVIKFTDKETLYIENETNTGSSGTHISFKIDKELNVCDLEYYTWDDLEDGSQTEFIVQDYEIKINKNPFKSGINNIKGIYNFKIKSHFIPGEMLLRENLKPKTDIFTYKAIFKCK